MISSWSEFWNTNIIGGATINEIVTPKLGQFGFMGILYLVIVISVPVFLLFFKSPARSFSKTVVYAFLFSGFLFSMRMDLNWASMLKADSERFLSKSEDERLRLMVNADFFEFLAHVKKKLPEGEKIRDVEDKALSNKITTGEIEAEPVDLITYVYLKIGKYYLLPVETSKNGKFVWVFAPMRAEFDADNMALTINNHIFNVRSYEPFTDKAVLFEIME